MLFEGRINCAELQMYRNNIYYAGPSNIPRLALTDKCIVLDLDQTLVATQDDLSDLQNLGLMNDPVLRRRVYQLTIPDPDDEQGKTMYKFWGITRPHVEEFLLFCFSYFRVVAVWSAGQKPYVDAIVSYLFQDLPAPHVVFTSDDTVRPSEYITIKPLQNMFESSNVLLRYMSLANTVTIDDNPTTFQENPDNGILIPPYTPFLNYDSLSGDDTALLQLKCWLQQPMVQNALDIREIAKDEIFTTSLSAYPHCARLTDTIASNVNYIRVNASPQST